MREPPSNTGASVRQRLLNLAREQGQPMELLLTRYALERLLHRLSNSQHRERFVLKGAMLLVAWFHEQHRATRDLDLLGFGSASHDVLLQTFREIMALPFDDGVSFDLAALTIAPIREQTEYGGSRLRTTAALAGARIPITIDIGFGDAVDPGTAYVELPVLLGMPAPRLRSRVLSWTSGRGSGQYCRQAWRETRGVQCACDRWRRLGSDRLPSRFRVSGVHPGSCLRGS